MGGGYLLIILVLLVVTNGITYGVTSIQSESVSYTKDGKTMNVKQALDDLIVKVDQKSGNFNITLAEQPIVNGKTVDATTYKTIVNGLIDKMVSAMGTTGTMSELTALKNATLTWTSENATIATVSGTSVTGKAVGHTKIIGTDSTGKKVTVPLNVIAGEYLADKVTVGDYVAYTVSNWTSSAGLPTSSGNFGGYISGTSKGKSVAIVCNTVGNDKTTLNGWRVLEANTSTKTVTLVHAGIPECYYHGTNSSDSVTKLNEETNKYKNSFADSAHAITYDEATKFTTSDTLRTIGARYWLATPKSGSSTYIYGISDNGSLFDKGSDSSYGFRPVIVLKSTVLTTGQGKDEFNQTAWILA